MKDGYRRRGLYIASIYGFVPHRETTSSTFLLFCGAFVCWTDRENDPRCSGYLVANEIHSHGPVSTLRLSSVRNQKLTTSRRGDWRLLPKFRTVLAGIIQSFTRRRGRDWERRDEYRVRQEESYRQSPDIVYVLPVIYCRYQYETHNKYLS